ncbi:MAG: phosphatidate cytidylyltransferase [Planctomycetota bacterium]|nr:MAG: phosphatidate cytidylyltransferase [Planctomycetota bacterium]
MRTDECAGRRTHRRPAIRAICTIPSAVRRRKRPQRCRAAPRRVVSSVARRDGRLRFPTSGRRGKAMLRWRLLMSAILIPAFVAIFVADHRAGADGRILWVVAMLLAARSGWELGDLMRKGGWSVQPAPLSLACTLGVAAFWGPRFVPHPSVQLSGSGALVLQCAGTGLLASSVLLAASFAHRCIRFVAPAGHLQGLCAEALGLLYVVGGIGLTAQLRWLPTAELGYVALGSLVVAVKCGDIFAYTFGRLFGKRKMAPHLSPGKTWAGFVGALVGGGVGACVWFGTIPSVFGEDVVVRPWPVAFGYGIVLAAVGLMGDLAESLIKREVEQKDASELLPGFGGLLDLLDSVLYSGPIILIWWLWWPLVLPR